MQTLGLAESTPRTENRIKSLLWPSIQTATDVDYLGTHNWARNRGPRDLPFLFPERLRC